MRGFPKANKMANLAQELAKKAEQALAIRVSNNTNVSPPEILEANRKGCQDAKDAIANIFNELALSSSEGFRQYGFDVTIASQSKTFTFYEAGYVATLIGLLEAQGFNSYTTWFPSVNSDDAFACKLIITW